MGSLLGELGKKLAERWLTLLVLPGTLYLAAVTVASTLGHGHALDVPRLTARITGWAKAPVAESAGGQVILLAAVLAGSAAAGLAAQAGGSLIERLVLAAGWRAWPAPLRRVAHWSTARRKARWNDAHAAYHRLREEAAVARALGGRADPADREGAWYARERISTEEPGRPTWSGDRIQSADARLHRDLGVELNVVWPYVWLRAGDPVRAEITTARGALGRAGVLGAWAVLYAALTVWWWPAAPLAAVLAIIARQRIRTASDAYARLLEAAVRLHGGEIAQSLGVEVDGPLTPESGRELVRLIGGSPPPPA